MKNNIIRKSIFKIRDLILPRHHGKDAYEEIRKHLNSDNAFMAARFGAVEIKAMLYCILPPPINLCLHKYAFYNMRMNAGFFPCEKSYLKRFTQTMLEDIKLIDILVSWRPEEIFFSKSLRKAFRIGLDDLVPSNDHSFWTHALKGKHVLVIHPFAESIEKQYGNREKLFDNPDTLPEFASLRTIKAVQTIAGNSTRFGNWFEALEYMKHETDKQDFDVALIGCGAYGLPLAAHIKRKGKKSIHMGGSLQLLFGIKGRRWDNSPLYNKYWISPSASERPSNLNMVENGCYW